VSEKAIKRTKPIEDYPIGSKFPAIMGGHWYKVSKRGYKWNGPDGGGGVFPGIGGDNSGTVILPDDRTTATAKH
jgi:hypothetical protein